MAMTGGRSVTCLGCLAIWFCAVLTQADWVNGQSTTTARSATASQSNTTAYSASNALSSNVGQSATVADDEATRLRFLDYEIRLNAILKTRRDEEKKFIHDILAMVREGRLPEPLVEQSYKWVLNKRSHTDYPFVYFERVLRIRSEQAEIEIPEFDYEVYRVRPDRR